jgi:flagellar capping protein FliD
MSDNELLLAISDMMDKKLKATLQPIENRLDRIENKITNISLTLENDIRPRLNTIESCYTDTYNRYKDYAEKMDAAFTDIEIMKKVITEHSEALQKLQKLA